VIRRHSELGRDIVAGAGMDEIADWILHLHERVDGGGYPAGLAGEEIPPESCILHCADALEAMTSSRVYRPGMPVDEALEELERHAGTQFAPAVVKAMAEMVRSGRLTVDVPAVVGA
jgi:HD-GYP domain-containing protein (c-di-GMP phosphodiesterase class II)